MIDSKVFAELQNRGIITVVGLNPADFNSIDELINLGLVTQISGKDVYESLMKNNDTLADITAKFLADIAAGGNVVVPCDLSFNTPIEITGDVTIDLNGHTLTNTPWDEDGESNAYVFWVKGGKLTLTGNGTVHAADAHYSMAVWANGGNVEINGGTYKNGGDSCDLIYASKKGSIVIKDGSFIAAGPASGTEPGTNNPYSALNIKDKDKKTCTISVEGGKFYKFNPADNLSENPKMNFVADGYESVQDGDWFVVRETEGIVVDDTIPQDVE